MQSQEAGLEVDTFSSLLVPDLEEEEAESKVGLGQAPPLMLIPKAPPFLPVGQPP